MLCDAAIKDQIAEAVHRAVVDVEGRDGAGLCLSYLNAGFGLLLHLFKSAGFLPQAGSLRIQPDPNDPTFWIERNATGGGYERGEYHCWLASPHETLIDFSARHYATRAHVNLGLQDDVPWNRPAPPNYLWCHWCQVPKWVRFRVDLPTTKAIRNLLLTDRARALRSAAWRHYQNVD